MPRTERLLFRIRNALLRGSRSLAPKPSIARLTDRHGVWWSYASQSPDTEDGAYRSDRTIAPTVRLTTPYRRRYVLRPPPPGRTRMTTPTTCPTERDGDDEVVRQWAAGALSPVEANEFEAHLQTCTRCRRAVEYAAGVTADLRAAAHAKPEPKKGQPWWLWSVLALTAVALLVVALN